MALGSWYFPHILNFHTTFPQVGVFVLFLKFEIKWSKRLWILESLGHQFYFVLWFERNKLRFAFFWGFICMQYFMFVIFFSWNLVSKAPSKWIFFSQDFQKHMDHTIPRLGPQFDRSHNVNNHSHTWPNFIFGLGNFSGCHGI